MPTSLSIPGIRGWLREKRARASKQASMHACKQASKQESEAGRNGRQGGVGRIQAHLEGNQKHAFDRELDCGHHRLLLLFLPPPSSLLLLLPLLLFLPPPSSLLLLRRLRRHHHLLHLLLLTHSLARRIQTCCRPIQQEVRLLIAGVSPPCDEHLQFGACVGGFLGGGACGGFGAEVSHPIRVLKRLANSLSRGSSPRRRRRRRRSRSTSSSRLWPTRCRVAARAP